MAMATDPEILRARAAGYREKAAELRARASTPSRFAPDLLTMARDYEVMAQQLEDIMSSGSS
jgi:hypothetical protein